MLLVLAKNIIKNGCREDFLAVARNLVENTRNEPGCMAYDLVTDQENDGICYFVEKYADETAFAAHRASRHFQTYVPQLNDYRSEPSQMTVCKVELF